MWDIILEIIRAIVISLLLYYTFKIGRARALNLHRGWNYILAGWAFILFGSILDITDNFESLNWLVVVGDTETEAFLEKFVGLLIGYILLFIGFLLWLPEGANKMDSLKSDFVSTVSHELRTPLTAIYGALRLVTSGAVGNTPPKVKDTLNIALRNSERLNLIVNDILDIAKLERGEMKFDITPHEITELINESMLGNKDYGKKYQIQYKLSQDSVSAKVNVDAGRFMQVMTNLLSNAAKFSPPDSIVEIRTARINNKIRVSVMDKGKGIDKESQPYIFQKFFQANSSNQRTPGGTGLGLAISKSFIEKMNGEIGFDSIIGKGTTFYINLPEVYEE